MKLILLPFIISFSALATSPEFSRRSFDEGVALRSMGGTITTCSQDPKTRIFCEEGFWFSDSFLQWGSTPKDRLIWAIPLPSSGVQAVSIGMALALRLNEIPEGYLHLGTFSHYVVDGWGFMTGIQPVKRSIPCPGGNLWRYCEFGRGRSTFFTSVPPRSTIEKLGRNFANGMHGLSAPPNISQISEGLRGLPLSPEMRSCLSLHHLLDCIKD